ESLFEEAPAFPQIRRRFRLQNKLNFLGEILDAVQLERHRHSPARSHRVDRDWKLRGPAVDRWLLEEQGLPAAGRFHFAIRPFANHQIGLDRDRHACQFAGSVERVDELAERAVSHHAKMAFPVENNKSARPGAPSSAAESLPGWKPPGRRRTSPSSTDTLRAAECRNSRTDRKMDRR